tara:strand:- start:3252 stop:4778 length:1527 start_codon:yes stop_codon:yes gene_type:complete
MESLKEKCFSKIDELLEIYKNNEHMIDQIDIQINTLLEKTLKTEFSSYEQKEKLKNSLETQQNNFVKVFLSKNRYYYLSQNNTECFFEYDGKHYSVVKKDDIIHKLLVTISEYKDLHEWKFVVTDMIMKHIKERSLHTTVPESNTIQYVLKLLTPSVFSDRDSAKYFLMILGDNIFKKNKDLLYIPYGKSKQFLGILENYAYITIGHSNLIKNFVKYHETHNYNNCRLLHFRGERENEITVNQALDLFCVACYYSTRFGNADEFINKKAKEQLKKYSLFLKDQTYQQIVEHFCDEMITNVHESSPSTSNYILKMKDVHYLWKSYLSKSNLPNVIYINTVKQLLIQNYDFDVEHECFKNITSKHLPLVRNFLSFWNSHVTSSEEDELEIEELCMLFKTVYGQIDEGEALKIVYHFYPEVEIIENKYIKKMACDLWNKKEDILFALNKMKEEYQKKNAQEFISFDDAYKYYCKVFKNKYITNKRYFENYLRIYLKHFIVYETFLSNDWYS